MIETKPRAASDLRLLQPDVILPSQLLPEFGRPMMPEKRLMVAIVDDAVNCFLRYRFATHPRSRRLFREAEQWIMDRNRSWPFSFETICDTLGLDAGCLRYGLLQWHARHPELGGKPWRVASAAEPAENGSVATALQVVA